MERDATSRRFEKPGLGRCGLRCTQKPSYQQNEGGCRRHPREARPKTLGRDAFPRRPTMNGTRCGKSAV